MRHAVAELDRRLRAGMDVGASFDELERSLGLDRLPDDEDDAQAPSRPDASDDEEADEEDEPGLPEAAKVPDFPGVVGAMVEEFLWEEGLHGRAGSPEQAEVLHLFSRLESRIGLFEDLSLIDVLRFAAFWLPESGALDSGARASRALDALEGFCAWAVENHAPPRLAGAVDTLRELRESLPRATEANQSLEVTPRLVELDTSRPGELYEFLGEQAPGRARVRDLRQDEHVLEAPSRTVRLLAAGDRLRASRREDRLVIHCCYPPQIALLEPDR